MKQTKESCKDDCTYKGFTLIEILVVILIIGILTAIALPQYKKVREKSKVGEALLVMDSVAKGQQNWYVLKEQYTKDFDDLDINLIDKDGNQATSDNYESKSYSHTLKDTGMLSERNNNEYMLYLDYETKQILCTPSEHYICKDFAGLTKEPCKSANLTWAKTNTTCYSSDEARCKGLHGDSMWKGTYCGYTNTNGKEINEGMVCNNNKESACQNSIVNDGGVCAAHTYNDCNSSTINSGGICKGGFVSCNGVTVNKEGVCEAAHYSCQSSTFSGGTCIGNGVYSCNGSTFENGSKCVTSGTYSCSSTTFKTNSICEGSGIGCNNITIADGGICVAKDIISCGGVTVKDGGICYANAYGTCGRNWASSASTYEGTGCCCGNYCPSSAPKCDSSKCDSQYMK